MLSRNLARNTPLNDGAYTSRSEEDEKVAALEVTLARLWLFSRSAYPQSLRVNCVASDGLRDGIFSEASPICLDGADDAEPPADSVPPAEEPPAPEPPAPEPSAPDSPAPDLPAPDPPAPDPPAPGLPAPDLPAPDLPAPVLIPDPSPSIEEPKPAPEPDPPPTDPPAKVEEPKLEPAPEPEPPVPDPPAKIEEPMPAPEPPVLDQPVKSEESKSVPNPPDPPAPDPPASIEEPKPLPSPPAADPPVIPQEAKPLPPPATVDEPKPLPTPPAVDPPLSPEELKPLTLPVSTKEPKSLPDPPANVVETKPLPPPVSIEEPKPLPIPPDLPAPPDIIEEPKPLPPPPASIEAPKPSSEPPASIEVPNQLPHPPEPPISIEDSKPLPPDQPSIEEPKLLPTPPPIIEGPKTLPEPPANIETSKPLPDPPVPPVIIEELKPLPLPVKTEELTVSVEGSKPLVNPPDPSVNPEGPRPLSNPPAIIEEPKPVLHPPSIVVQLIQPAYDVNDAIEDTAGLPILQEPTLCSPSTPMPADLKALPDPPANVVQAIQPAYDTNDAEDTAQLPNLNRQTFWSPNRPHTVEPPQVSILPAVTDKANIIYDAADSVEEVSRELMSNQFWSPNKLDPEAKVTALVKSVVEEPSKTIYDAANLSEVVAETSVQFWSPIKSNPVPTQPIKPVIDQPSKSIYDAADQIEEVAESSGRIWSPSKVETTDFIKSVVDQPSKTIYDAADAVEEVVDTASSYPASWHPQRIVQTASSAFINTIASAFTDAVKTAEEQPRKPIYDAADAIEGVAETVSSYPASWYPQRIVQAASPAVSALTNAVKANEEQVKRQDSIVKARVAALQNPQPESSKTPSPTKPSSASRRIAPTLIAKQSVPTQAPRSVVNQQNTDRQTSNVPISMQQPHTTTPTLPPVHPRPVEPVVQKALQPYANVENNKMPPQASMIYINVSPTQQQSRHARDPKPSQDVSHQHYTHCVFNRNRGDRVSTPCCSEISRHHDTLPSTNCYQHRRRPASPVRRPPTPQLLLRVQSESLDPQSKNAVRTEMNETSTTLQVATQVLDRALVGLNHLVDEATHLATQAAQLGQHTDRSERARPDQYALPPVRRNRNNKVFFPARAHDRRRHLRTSSGHSDEIELVDRRVSKRTMSFHDDARMIIQSKAEDARPAIQSKPIKARPVIQSKAKDVPSNNQDTTEDLPPINHSETDGVRSTNQSKKADEQPIVQSLTTVTLPQECVLPETVPSPEYLYAVADVVHVPEYLFAVPDVVPALEYRSAVPDMVQVPLKPLGDPHGTSDLATLVQRAIEPSKPAIDNNKTIGSNVMSSAIRPKTGDDFDTMTIRRRPVAVHPLLRPARQQSMPSPLQQDTVDENRRVLQHARTYVSPQGQNMQQHLIEYRYDGSRSQQSSRQSSNRPHLSLPGGHGVPASFQQKQDPIARDWTIARKRITACIACSNTIFVGLLAGIYAGEVPRIQYQIADLNHRVILGNVLLYVGIAVTTLLFWPLPLLHGRKPYTVVAFALMLPLQYPQALAVAKFQEPDSSITRVGLLLPRLLTGIAMGFANINFLPTLLDLFGASLMSDNPHQEHVQLDDLRRQGGGIGIWLGIWSWCYTASLSIGFSVGAVIIQYLEPVWGFYLTIILLAVFLMVNIVAPETRPAPHRQSIVHIFDHTFTWRRRIAKGEVHLHLWQTGPKWWFEEVWAGIVLMFKMTIQIGFFIMIFYVAWIFALVVLIIVLLGALLSTWYRWRSDYVGAASLALAVGALLAIPLTHANWFSRSRVTPPRPNSMTLKHKGSIRFTSHMLRRCIFTLILPLAGLVYTLASPGPKVQWIVPVVFVGLVGFLSILAISECVGLMMETFDTCDLQVGANNRHREKSLPEAVRKARTHYTAFPRICAGFFAAQGLGFLFAAVATAVSGTVTRAVGAQLSAAGVAGILLVLTILLLAILLRFKGLQVIPNGILSSAEIKSPWASSLPRDADWRPVILGNPTGKMRRVSLFEMGSMSRWSEIRRLNGLQE